MNPDYTKHQDMRRNNPTMENRRFFVKEEEKPYDMLYPRDPSLDPQLVWKGKDEQDREPLAVATVPIYVQEKIHPAQIIAELKRQSRGKGEKGQGSGVQETPRAYAEAQLDLFGDFNGLEAQDELDKLQKSTEFYQHNQHWTNRMILGDSLLVMNSLAEKEGLRGQVQCIYMDPPYGIKFGSNWQVSTRKRDVKDGKAEDIAREPEVIRAFRDTWKLGIHSYLAYLRDRLVVARELLTESGSVFVQIGDENVHLVRSLMDEVFGSENFVSQITFTKTGGQADSALASIADYIIWYAKDQSQVQIRKLYTSKELGGAGASKYTSVLLSNGESRSISQVVDENGNLPAASRVYRLDTITSSRPAQKGDTTEFYWNSRRFTPGSGTFKTNTNGLSRLAIANRLASSTNTLNYVRFLDDFSAFPITNVWTDFGGIQSRLDPKIYVVQTATEAVKRCILMTTDPGQLVLDPTCGSGTTAYVAEQWGRRWITTDTSRVSLALARTRVMAGRYPYYLLADSPEGVRKEAELSGIVPPNYATGGDVRKGFVYERVPHIKLSDIANNPDIREGMTRTEIDAAIARHADTETLFDKPYADKNKIRVSGPFTVESLSPHRVLPAAEEPVAVGSEPSASGAEGYKDRSSALQADGETLVFKTSADDAEAENQRRGNDFATMVLENLRKSGVQNTKKGERLVFETLEPYAGRWIQARGSYTTTDGETKRVAVSLGPEYGAVGPQQVVEAAKEAMQGLGHDILVVTGYAFDPHVSEESRRIGELTILPARMNADLAMGDELLKKTGAGNLFMVFGEPDVDIRKEDGEVTVELLGLDVYDPTTGEIRSSSTDEIAAWFIDTDYNGESFFVRHAYFVGAEVTDKKDGSKYDPYRALRSTLRAEIDEEAWASIYSTVSRPFPIPSSGKIAIKVINHYGDEVLRVATIEKV